MNRRLIFFPLVICVAVAGVLLGGCARDFSANVYSSGQAQQIQSVREGTIIALTPVVIKDDANPVGTISGGVVGGLAATQIGGGVGSDIATVGGVVIGGLLGNMAEQAITQRQGVNIAIRLKSGELIAIVQDIESDVRFQVGGRVLVYSQPGSSRVVPF